MSGQVFKGLENGHGSFLEPGSCISIPCIFLCKSASRHLALRMLLSNLSAAACSPSQPGPSVCNSCRDNPRGRVLADVGARTWASASGYWSTASAGRPRWSRGFWNGGHHFEHRCKPLFVPNHVVRACLSHIGRHATSAQVVFGRGGFRLLGPQPCHGTTFVIFVPLATVVMPQL
jgi:hypothetical protein